MNAIASLKASAPLLLIMLVCPAALAEEAYFKTPSNNIYCMYFDDGETAELRCDISEYKPSNTQPPDGCDLDWGGAFVIDAKANRGTMLCHGDTVISGEAKTLRYGTSWQGGGITCTSEKAGLTCENSKGHGFFLSRAKQKVF
jgi:hypothetical protein